MVKISRTPLWFIKGVLVSDQAERSLTRTREILQHSTTKPSPTSTWAWDSVSCLYTNQQWWCGGGGASKRTWRRWRRRWKMREQPLVSFSAVSARFAKYRIVPVTLHCSVHLHQIKFLFVLHGCHFSIISTPFYLFSFEHLHASLWPSSLYSYQIINWFGQEVVVIEASLEW